jgi:hypothetical protein
MANATQIPTNRFVSIKAIDIDPRSSHVWPTATVVVAVAVAAIPLLASLQKQCGIVAAATTAAGAANAIVASTSTTYAAATNSGRSSAAAVGATRRGGRYPSPSRVIR